MVLLSNARALRVPLRWGLTVCAVFALIASGLSEPAEGANSRPSFQIPFRCGQRWEASTRAGHRAIDWNKGSGSDDLGQPVTASAAGAADAKYDNEYGYYVDVDHGGGWVTRYAHLLARGRPEGPVAQGEVIGYVGSSGSSTAPHLHWEQRQDDVPQTTLSADDDTMSTDREYTSRNCLRRDPFLAGDIDGDGDDDLVARFVQGDGSSTVKVVAGDDRRDLTARPSLQLTDDEMPATALLTLGDTTGEGRADLNGAYEVDGGVRVVTFPGRSDTTFGDRRVRYFNSNWNFRRLQSIRAADVDGDRIDDVTLHFVSSDGSSKVRVIRGSTSRELTKVRSKTIDASNLPRNAKTTMGDTNGDKRADLNAAVGAGDGMRLVSFYGAEDGSLGSRRSRMVRDSWSFRNLKVVRAGDLDGDRVDDVVARFVRRDGSTAIRSVFGKTSRDMTRTTTKDVGASTLPARAQIAVGDSNGNGRADLNAAMGASDGVRVASFTAALDGQFSERKTRYYGEGWAFHRLC